jgi:hypothetical protein
VTLISCSISARAGRWGPGGGSPLCAEASPPSPLFSVVLPLLYRDSGGRATAKGLGRSMIDSGSSMGASVPATGEALYLQLDPKYPGLKQIWENPPM